MFVVYGGGKFMQGFPKLHQRRRRREGEGEGG
jgi:hypothetical protein